VPSWREQLLSYRNERPSNVGLLSSVLTFLLVGSCLLLFESVYSNFKYLLSFVLLIVAVGLYWRPKRSNARLVIVVFVTIVVAGGVKSG